MKYRDVITVFLGILFFLSLAFTLGVEKLFWPITVILFAVFVIVVYKLWIEK